LLIDETRADCPTIDCGKPWVATGQFAGRFKKFACLRGALRELTRMQDNEALWPPPRGQTMV